MDLKGVIQYFFIFRTRWKWRLGNVSKNSDEQSSLLQCNQSVREKFAEYHCYNHGYKVVPLGPLNRVLFRVGKLYGGCETHLRKNRPFEKCDRWNFIASLSQRDSYFYMYIMYNSTLYYLHKLNEFNLNLYNIHL